MKDIYIVTDSACDIASELLAEWGVGQVRMFYTFEKDALDKDSGIKAFYDHMREGCVAKTAAVNPNDFCDVFQPILQNGYDILYLAFSSGLSTTYHSACLAAQDLRETFPDRKITVVDSLCASAGEGLFVYLVAQKKQECQSLEELTQFAESLKRQICHWFTVDDLVYLKRGGRVSPTVAFVGGVLGIKPILHVDNDGHLINAGKVRGRKASIQALADQYGKLALAPSEGTVFISNGDCREDAEFLAKILKDRYGITARLITDIGPVIGAHSGPGTLALFFVGKER